MRNFFLTRYRNHKKYLAKFAMAAVASAGLAAGTTQAALITIPNSGFETHPPDPDLDSFPRFGGISSAPPWTGSGYWAGNGYGYAAHTGTGLAWVDPPSATITQTLTLAGSGTDYQWAQGTYTLNGFLWAKFNPAPGHSVTTELLGGVTSLGSISTTANTNGSWNALNTLTVVVGASDPNIGSPIQILITATGAGFGHRNLDDFSLNFEPVPEPSSIALLSIGAGGLGLIARRRHRS